MKRHFYLVAFVLFSCGKGLNERSGKKQFVLLDAAKTGVRFSNDIKEDVGTKFNLFDYDYFYNGGGVGVADINNDGLSDLFFTGNQVDNKLFLNKGKLEFEDISESAGINQNKYWSNGVTFADVNNDGFLDIYVSQGGPHKAEARGNLLLINNGDLTFSERAAEYGLNDTSISTQSAFFDYDLDGDLDCFVMNETTLYGLGPLQFFKALRSEKSLIHESSSHMYENKDGIFEDVTIEAGILRPTFGLGLTVSDINDDGWPDIYVANDYYLPDNLYINNGSGYFIDQITDLTNHISFYGMGVDVVDINNDLSNDIFVVDMASSDHIRAKTLMASMDPEGFDLLTKGLGFQTQYMFNSLQLNNGLNQFSNASQLKGLAKTDWSWAVLIEDLNNDTYQDTYITNGYRKYALDNDFKNEVVAAKQRYNNNVPLNIKAELYDKMPSEKLSNLLYSSDHDFAIKEVSASWGLDIPSFSNGAAVADLDNDGDLDLVVNNIDENAYVFKNQNLDENNYLRVKVNGDLSESFAKVFIYYAGGSQLKEIKRVRGYRSSVDNVAHFGLAKETKIDSILVKWRDASVSKFYEVDANQLLVIEKPEKPAKPTDSQENELADNEMDVLPHQHLENEFNDFERETLLPYKQSMLGPKISMDDESKLLFVGGAYGQNGTVYYYKGPSNLIKVAEIESKDYEDIHGKFIDIENDGDLDLFVSSGGNEYPPGHQSYVDRLYINDGTNQFARKEIEGLEEVAQSSGVVEVVDINNDGFNDIIVGNRITPQYYPFPGASYILMNDKGELRIENEVFSDLDSLGIVNDIHATDIDNDGWKDLVLVGEWSNVEIVRNEKGKLKRAANNPSLEELKGWWFSIAELDINNDNLPDFVIGNVGENFKLSASIDKPLKVRAYDFDSTGTVDVVLSKKYKDSYVPVRGRECSSGQMPFIKDKFPTYEGFANASMEDIFGSALEKSYKAEASTFRSKLLVNKGNWEFEILDLPWQAQMFPVLDMEVSDFNNDGINDVILAGNIYETEVETPRLDAYSGLILFGDGTGLQAGPSLNIPGNVRSIEIVEKENSLNVVVARNNDFMLSYTIDR